MRKGVYRMRYMKGRKHERKEGSMKGRKYERKAV
jgi:hypothetical protein